MNSGNDKVKINLNTCLPGTRLAIDWDICEH